jgi:tRNA pseudouridine13 synthase
MHTHTFSPPPSAQEEKKQRKVEERERRQKLWQDKAAAGKERQQAESGAPSAAPPLPPSDAGAEAQAGVDGAAGEKSEEGAKKEREEERKGEREGEGEGQKKDLRSAPFVFLAILDKNARTVLHKTIKQNFPDVVTDVKEGATPEERFVVAHFRGDMKGRPRDEREWPEGRGKYLHFTLYKDGRDTMDAIDTIAQCIHTQPKIFSYAGTKDKRAITVQRVSAYRLLAKKLKTGCAYLSKQGNGNLIVGNFSYRNDDIKLGALRGNHFRVALRYVPNVEPVAAAVASLSARGFINYYGMQRFGTATVPTHAVGRALLLGQFGLAVGLILQPRKGDRPFVDEARKYFESTRDVRGALKKFPAFLTVERRVLQGLDELGANAFLNAIERIPRPMRLMYVHSYQSYVWNSVVSARLNELGELPVPGDLVLAGAGNGAEGAEEEEEEGAEEAAAAATAAAGEGAGEADAKDGGLEGLAVSEAPYEHRMDAGSTVDEYKSKLREKVYVLLPADVESGRYSITDVVMPLPGYAVHMPTHHIASRYAEILAKDGMTMESFRNKIKEFSLPGGYRKIVHRPRDMAFHIAKFDGDNEKIAADDFDILRGKVPPVKTEGNHNAVVLSFTLPSSTYATMLLREATKQSTSLDHQKSLTASAQNEEPKARRPDARDGKREALAPEGVEGAQAQPVAASQAPADEAMAHADSGDAGSAQVQTLQPAQGEGEDKDDDDAFVEVAGNEEEEEEEEEEAEEDDEFVD